MSKWSEAIKSAAEKHPGTPEIKFSYGTAGFRTLGNTLDPVLFRVGLLAVLRSKLKNAAIGVMVTASHNPEQDNGAKLVDPMGEMLEASWEGHATKIANCADEDLIHVIEEIAKSCSIPMSTPAKVVCARDTRATSLCLITALKDGVSAMDGAIVDGGLMTTPQLHYIVRCTNDAEFGVDSERGYYEKTAAAFTNLYKLSGTKEKLKINLDCANGVGAPKFCALQVLIGNMLEATVFNDGSSGKLNEKSGADFVKSGQVAPPNMPKTDKVRCASFDGDADRVVYYFFKDGQFNLMDGDRISILAAEFISEQLKEAGLSLKLGVVQTAYANGASSRYLTETLKLPVGFACTGVKYLHHKAQDYDIGVYFEANGHGTVLFSDVALKAIRGAKGANDAQNKAIEVLKNLINLINQTVGDAISDLLLVEIILAFKRMTIEQWAQSYVDLPNKLLKVTIKDRNVIKTTDAERICTEPAGLQAAIDKAVAGYPQGRSFARPSGTEDVVRVYAEAATREEADDLAYEVAALVYKHAQGVGENPSNPSKRVKH